MLNIHGTIFWSIIVATKNASKLNTPFRRITYVYLFNSCMKNRYVGLPNGAGFVLTCSANFMAQSIAEPSMGAPVIFLPQINNSAIFQTFTITQLVRVLLWAPEMEMEREIDFPSCNNMNK